MDTTARNKLMDYLARRDHSEKELRTKLAENFPSEEVDAALQYAKEHHWLLPPEELAEKTAKTLHKKRKGHLYINSYLREKGLPPVEKSHELEFEKALAIIESNQSESQPLKREKAVRLLTNRGYETDVIRKVIYEVL